MDPLAKSVHEHLLKKAGVDTRLGLVTRTAMRFARQFCVDGEIKKEAVIDAVLQFVGEHSVDRATVAMAIEILYESAPGAYKSVRPLLCCR